MAASVLGLVPEWYIPGYSTGRGSGMRLISLAKPMVHIASPVAVNRHIRPYHGHSWPTPRSTALETQGTRSSIEPSPAQINSCHSLGEEPRDWHMTRKTQRVDGDAKDHHILVACMRLLDKRRVTQIAMQSHKFPLSYRQAALGAIAESLYDPHEMDKCLELCSGQSKFMYKMKPNSRIYDSLILKICLSKPPKNIDIALELAQLAASMDLTLGSPAMSALINALRDGLNWQGLKWAWEQVILSRGKIDQISYKASISLLHAHIHTAKASYKQTPSIDHILLDTSPDPLLDTIHISPSDIEVLDRILELKSPLDLEMSELHIAAKLFKMLRMPDETLNVFRLICLGYEQYAYSSHRLAHIREFIRRSFRKQGLTKEKFSRNRLVGDVFMTTESETYLVKIEFIEILLSKGYIQEALQIAKSMRDLYSEFENLVAVLTSQKSFSRQASMLLINLAASQTLLINNLKFQKAISRLILCLHSQHYGKICIPFIIYTIELIGTETSFENGNMMCEALLECLLAIDGDLRNTTHIFCRMVQPWPKIPPSLVRILFRYTMERGWVKLAETINIWAAEHHILMSVPASEDGGGFCSSILTEFPNSEKIAQG
ncbi:hypothetical protein BSLG_006648 [Batrachochytrium salamandrivorans]|nr:hypothetical protein BSLG_006648 [Batrachochytrium salamandrivorans]